MEKVTLVVQPRDLTGSRNARRLRKSGLIPGVLYGHGKGATAFAVDPHALRPVLVGGGTHAVLSVTVEGHSKAHNAIVKELELDRVKSTVTHIDLQEIRLDETIETTVTVSFEGEAIGLKAGGMLDESTREVTIKGLVTAIPERLVLDISAMDINDTAKVGDLVVPEGIEVMNDPEEVLCSLLPPRKVEEELEEGAEAVEGAVAGAEPEIVGKGEAEESAE
ncbi:MAG TPA: 50S ribosomal protein L25 [Thermoleophilia bacterium]|nr:50S ribosomal protein L25 [Thermoleophilia bacterium]